MTYYVNTKTQQEYNELIKLCASQGKKWGNPKKIPEELPEGKEYFPPSLCYTTIKIEDDVFSISDFISYIKNENADIISLKEYKKQIGLEAEHPKEKEGETFTRGELVEVSDDEKNWEKMIFVVKIEGIDFEIIVVDVDDEENLKKGEGFNIYGYKYIKKIKS